MRFDIWQFMSTSNNEINNEFLQSEQHRHIGEGIVRQPFDAIAWQETEREKNAGFKTKEKFG